MPFESPAWMQFMRQGVSVNALCIVDVMTYAAAVPKLWHDTIETHRQSVRDAILETAASLVAEHGLRSVTMSEIAARTGIGRATLYKYFADVESMLLAWHERQIAQHLEELERLQKRPAPVGDRLCAVLEAYALIHHRLAAHHRPGYPGGSGNDLAVLLHRGAHVADAQRELEEFMRSLLADAAEAGVVRDDVSPAELATYCLHTLTAAGNLPSRAAVRRLVRLTLAGLHAHPSRLHEDGLAS
jgi:AcrR family transcriptional regulator